MSNVNEIDTAQLDDPSRTRPRPARRIPRTMWFITTAWGCLLLGASLVWPVTFGYDETPHIDMAYTYANQPFHFYEPGTLKISDTGLGIYGVVGSHPLTRRLSAVPMLPRNERPTLDQLGGPNLTGPINPMSQHPPLYYELVALVLRIPGVSHLSWDVQVSIMRLVSVLLMMPVPLLCWAAARRWLSALLPRGTLSTTVDRLAIAAAVIPFTLPNLIRDGSSVTNDALLISATSVLSYLLYRVVTADFATKTAIGVSTSLAVALLAKGFALVLPPIVLAAYLLGWFRQPHPTRNNRMVLLRPLAISAVGGVLGGLWWLRNLVLYGAIQPAGLGKEQIVPHTTAPLTAQLKHFVPRFTTDLSERIWGGVGYADVPRITPVVTFGFLIIALIGMLISPACGGRDNRWANLFFLSIPVLTFLVVAAGSFGQYRNSELAEVPRATQGRYLYHAIVVAAVLATVGWFSVLRPRIRPLVAPVVFGAGAIISASVWMMLLRGWYAPATQVSILRKTLNGVHSLLRFSPLPSAVTIMLTAVLPIVSCAAALVALIRDARSLRLPGDAAITDESLVPAAPEEAEVLTPATKVAAVSG